MTTRVYPALLVKDAGTGETAGIGVVFPDFPGCVSQGDDFAHAAEMALEALAVHVEGMVEDGEELPEPSVPGTVPDWLDPAETVVLAQVLVPVELPGRSVRVNITMDENLLRRADRAAEAQGMTRSGLLAQAVRDWLRDGRGSRPPPSRRRSA